MEVEKLKRKTIKRLKQIKEEQGLSIAKIMDLMEKQGKFVSEATLKKVFADGSEERSFRYQDSIAPVADVLLDIYGDTSGTEDAETLQKIIREKNKLIEFLLIKLEELNAAILDKDKAYGERKVAYENSIRILETQLNRCHEQISQKDELINRLFNAYLGVERNVPTAGIETG